MTCQTDHIRSWTLLQSFTLRNFLLIQSGNKVKNNAYLHIYAVTSLSKHLRWKIYSPIQAYRGLPEHFYLNNLKLVDNFVLKVKLYILFSWKVFMVIQGHISIGPMLKQGQYLIHHYNMGLPRQHYDYKMDFVCIK